MIFKKKYLVTIILILLAIIAFESNQLVISSRQRDWRLRSSYMADREMNQSLLSLVEEVWKYSGSAIHSFTRLERSSYYPFHEGFDQNCHGSILKMYSFKKDGKIKVASEIVFSSTDKEQQRIVRGMVNDSFFADETPYKVTKKMLLSYSEGQHSRTKNIKEIRDSFVTHTKVIGQMFEVYNGCKTEYTLKPMPLIKISGDLPSNGKELQAYRIWIEKTEGVDELQDAWGRKIDISLSNDKLSFRSSGADGVSSTKDDIVIERDVR